MNILEVILTSVKPLSKMVPNKRSNLNLNPWVWYFHQFQPCLQSAPRTNLLNQIFYVSLTQCRTCFPSLQNETAEEKLVMNHDPWKRLTAQRYKRDLTNHAHYLLTAWRFYSVKTKELCNQCVLIWSYMMMVIRKHP